MVNLEICHLTDPGGRSSNEDRVLAKRLGKLYLLAVADGIGGGVAGEVASSVAVREVEESLKVNLANEDIRTVVREAIVKANKEVYLLAKENPEYAGMGTTLVMAVIRQGKALIANVGDSRAYHHSGSWIKQITRDHSVIQMLIEKGLVAKEESANHPQRGNLTRALGVEPRIEADIYEVDLLLGDVLLLCSDGLTDSLRDEEIGSIIDSSIDLGKTCTNLVKLAKEKGSRDNISVALAKEIGEGIERHKEISQTM